MDCNTPPVPDADGVYPALGESWRQCAAIRDAAGLALRWTDPDRIVHAIEIWPTIPGANDATANTRCGVYDVLPEESWAGADPLTCASCASIELEDSE